MRVKIEVQNSDGLYVTLIDDVIEDAGWVEHLKTVMDAAVAIERAFNAMLEAAAEGEASGSC